MFLMRWCLPSLILIVLCAGPGWAKAVNYEAAFSLGTEASQRAADLLEADWSAQEAIVLTNAGYARPGEHSSRGCLDGLARATGTSVGASTLLRLQARFDQPLWFAFYLQDSGRCSYLQLDSEQAAQALSGRGAGKPAFALEQTARIDADSLLNNTASFQAECQKGLFGGNVFRVVTAANAAAAHCPDELVTAIEVHDHYCPGVTSGVLLVQFIRDRLFPNDPQANCFVLGLDPWCKEDALTTLLNATPGKRGYGVLYPDKEQVAAWPEPLNRACTAVFVQQQGRPWQGWILGFDFAKAKKLYSGPKSDSTILNKLNMDLWFLDYLDQPETFVSVLKTMTLETGQSPKMLLKPGIDPVAVLAGM